MNLGPNHLLRQESGEELGNLNDSLPDAQLFMVKMFDDHYRDIIQLLSMGYAPTRFTTTQKKQLVVRVVYFQLIIGQLYKMELDEILRRCVLEHDKPMILN